MTEFIAELTLPTTGLEKTVLGGVVLILLAFIGYGINKFAEISKDGRDSNEKVADRHDAVIKEIWDAHRNERKEWKDEATSREIRLEQQQKDRDWETY